MTMIVLLWNKKSLWVFEGFIDLKILVTDLLILVFEEHCPCASGTKGVKCNDIFFVR